MITHATTHDCRFELTDGSGSDSVHSDPVYSYAVTRLHTDGDNSDIVGEGSSFTLGDGNDIVCSLALQLANELLRIGGRDIEEIMARFGSIQKQLADHSRLRWLGPHKGAVHLALASVTNAVFDLWARSRNQPLWKLLLSLDDDSVVALLDVSWVEDVVSLDQARELLATCRSTRPWRADVITDGYPGYDTSVGWFNYSNEEIAVNTRLAVAHGFGALKLKVGSTDLDRDLERFDVVRDAAGPETRLMVDANQQWTWPQAEAACRALSERGAYWIEEPTHPDDVLGHGLLATIMRKSGSRMALGEHVANRVLFKNFMQAGAIDVVQVDALRVAGVSEFIVVSMMAKQFGLAVVPHVGDMGQLHQHLVIFNRVALDLPLEMLEYIPHLKNRFADPAIVSGGVYVTPTTLGAGQTLLQHGTEKES